jgi:polysaccharide export outer membrane protein
MKHFLTLLGASMAILCSGCLKYTPSHSELTERHSKGDAVVDQLGGAEEFKQYEAKLHSRLETFMQQRAHLLSPELQSTGHPVGPGDELQVQVFGFGNLNANTAIATDGSMILPLVGRVSVAGRSLDEVQNELNRRYANFIRSPQVNVSIKSPINNRVLVTGEVHKPGSYPLIRKGSLLTEILAEAGGRTPTASSRIIVLPSPRITESYAKPSSNTPHLSLASTRPTEEVIGVELDVEDLVGNIDHQPLLVPLLPGDTLIVPEAGHYEVDGEVGQPGSFNLTSRTSVMGAIAAARGFTYSAAVNNVEVIRDTGGGKKALIALDLEEVGLRGAHDLRLRDGDIVRVPSEPGRFLKQQIVETLNGVFNGFSVNKRVN